MRILCVCLGNICRSPMAEGAIRARAEAAGLSVNVDSAGTRALHAGEPPDPRGLSVARSRGYDNSAQRARQLSQQDFDDFDVAFAMDRTNLDELRRRLPEDANIRIELFHPDDLDIPDPYYGGRPEYEHALALIEAAADALIRDLVATEA